MVEDRIVRDPTLIFEEEIGARWDEFPAWLKSRIYLMVRWFALRNTARAFVRTAKTRLYGLLARG